MLRGNNPDADCEDQQKHAAHFFFGVNRELTPGVEYLKIYMLARRVATKCAECIYKILRERAFSKSPLKSDEQLN